MALMTGDQYVESPVDDPILRPSLNSVKATYDLAQMPEYEDLMTVTLDDGRKINRFAHIHRSAEDLVKKVKMQRLCGQKKAARWTLATANTAGWRPSLCLTTCLFQTRESS